MSLRCNNPPLGPTPEISFDRQREGYGVIERRACRGAYEPDRRAVACDGWIPARLDRR
jgi:hypothetical protein